MTSIKKKVAVVGSRAFNKYDLMVKELNKYDIDTIISGGAYGADKLAETYAKEKGIKLQIIYPDWKRYGRAAGPIRNKEIISLCDIVVAFWDEKSPGTYSSINLGRNANKEVHVVCYNKYE